MENEDHSQSSEVDHEPNQQRAHVVQEIDRLKPNSFEVGIHRLSIIQVENSVYIWINVDDIERRNLVDLTEEHLCIRWHLDIK